MIALAAQESGLDKALISDINVNAPSMLKPLDLSTEVISQAVIAQNKAINMIAVVKAILQWWRQATFNVTKIIGCNAFY